MARQSSMSYPGQGRPKDPNLPEDVLGEKLRRVWALKVSHCVAGAG